MGTGLFTKCLGSEKIGEVTTEQYDRVVEADRVGEEDAGGANNSPR
jgi:hypothetical protein